jgi:hypothetical protein
MSLNRPGFDVVKRPLLSLCVAIRRDKGLSLWSSFNAHRESGSVTQRAVLRLIIKWSVARFSHRNTNHLLLTRGRLSASAPWLWFARMCASERTISRVESPEWVVISSRMAAISDSL